MPSVASSAMITIQLPPSIGGLTGTGVSGAALTRFVGSASAAIGLKGEVHVLLADDDTLKRLNKTFRGKNKATDVLSFPAGPSTVFFGEPGEPELVGDLAVSLETAARQAERFGHTLADEVKVLLLHGLLHLAGLDHERDSGEMEAREAELRRQLRLPAGVIARVSGRATEPVVDRVIRRTATKSKSTRKAHP